jgi:aryl-alcohol dehydrogenase-like predicted oxidoreductase
VAVDIAATLDRMGTDRLDLWLFHRDDDTVPVGELVDAAQREVALGTIGAWGVSNWSAERFWEARSRADVALPVATSPQFSLVDQLAKPWPGVTTITGPANAEERVRLADSEISVITWSPLAGGFLTAARRPESATDAETTRCYDSVQNRDRRDRTLQLATSRGCSPEQVAIAYVATSPFRAHVVCAARNGLEAAANLQAAKIELTSEERQWLEDGDR